MNLKLILRIARTELAVLFYSPVAWLLLIAFTCQVGFDFMNILTEIVKIKALGNTITFSVTAGFVLGLKGIYEVIQETIYLYIPLLTMNLMSREYSSGSIKLLYSSPINSIQIITGKFVSVHRGAHGDSLQRTQGFHHLHCDGCPRQCDKRTFRQAGDA